MNVRHLSLAASVGLGAMAFAPSAEATFLYLSLQFRATVETPQGPRDVYRVYAHFTNGADRLNSWYGSTPDSTIIRSKSCFTGEAGSSFFDVPGHRTAPFQEDIDATPHLQWDTFATIGVSVADHGSMLPPALPDATTLMPQFPAFINGSAVTLNQSGVYVVGAPAQSRADYAGDGDPQLRVLMMQLTLPLDSRPEVLIGRISVYDAAMGVSLEYSNLIAWWMLEPWGRCCTAQGTCVVTDEAACVTVYSGTYLGCGDVCHLCQPPQPGCTGDIMPRGGDARVDVSDLLAVINGWGATSGVADINHDGIVDVSDLLAVINAWGPCP